MGVTVVLVRPEVAGNVGAVARLMGNFDVHRLVLVAPQCDHLSKEALDRAKHNKDVLKRAKVLGSLQDVAAGTRVATTSRVGSDFNLPRSPVLPGQLAGLVPPSADVAVVFGPEGPGLSNGEILACDFAVSIPTSRAYPAMNLSHAVAIILYELSAARPTDHIASHIRPMGASEKRQLLKMVDGLIDGIDWGAKASRPVTQRRLWHRLIGRSFLTMREAYALMGFLRQLRKPQKE